jgi:hypothetical protein
MDREGRGGGWEGLSERRMMRRETRGCERDNGNCVVPEETLSEHFLFVIFA